VGMTLKDPSDMHTHVGTRALYVPRLVSNPGGLCLTKGLRIVSTLGKTAWRQPSGLRGSTGQVHA